MSVALDSHLFSQYSSQASMLGQTENNNKQEKVAKRMLFVAFWVQLPVITLYQTLMNLNTS